MLELSTHSWIYIDKVAKIFMMYGEQITLLKITNLK